MQTAWFIAIALLWALYLVLEGFDFGVGMLLRRVRGDGFDRRVAIHAIGPTWAANEVWLVVAVVAMFGAFPGWYAAWASTFYLPLTVVLLALIARNTSIELLGKRDDEAWRRGWERVLFVASFVAPFCWGLIWTAALDGVALRGSEAVGGPLEVLTPVAVLGGLALVVLCRALGAAFLALRTEGEVASRAARELRRTAPSRSCSCGDGDRHHPAGHRQHPGDPRRPGLRDPRARPRAASRPRAGRGRAVLAGRRLTGRPRAISPRRATPAGRSRPGVSRSRSSSSGGSARCTRRGSTGRRRARARTRPSRRGRLHADADDDPGRAAARRCCSRSRRGATGCSGSG